MRYNILSIVLFLLCVSCSENFKTLDVSEFNLTIKHRTDISSAEELIILYYNYPKEELEPDIKIISEPGKDGIIKITLIHQGLMDDSVKAIKIIMLARNENKSWSILSIKTNWKCYEGRGHQNWDIKMCN